MVKAEAGASAGAEDRVGSVKKNVEPERIKQKSVTQRQVAHATKQPARNHADGALKHHDTQQKRTTDWHTTTSADNPHRPCSGTVRTESVPPMSCTSRCEMARPRPVPPNSRALRTDQHEVTAGQRQGDGLLSWESSGRQVDAKLWRMLRRESMEAGNTAHRHARTTSLQARKQGRCHGKVRTLRDPWRTAGTAWPASRAKCRGRCRAPRTAE